ncbi:heterokaryon incompatibility protein-domain-containing protein [Aspergillus avenaceus]|uniref:Heterokaryon incompatibility protein-domain-containing protein n=1 Tax=Aspergillus avenaceus TaxID=36643 RepID=A0A5N6TZH4_ASPAV|nr:heterokaryon incompatibility protein-domain-containing protein [Aspergillus avenaceus]
MSAYPASPQLSPAYVSRSAEAEKCSRCAAFPGKLYGRPLPAYDDNASLEQTRHLLFHEPCVVCSDTLNDTLCSECRHMRLGHIIRCWSNESSRPEIDLLFGTVGNVQTRSPECTVCRRLAVLSTLSTAVEESDMVVASIINVEESDSIRILVDADFWFHLYFQRPGTPLFTTLSSRFLSRLFIGLNHVPDEGTLAFLQRPSADVNWETVRSWLKECHIQHTNIYRLATPQPQPAGLRVIDVTRGCIMFAPQNCKYAALSYVWGRPTRPGLRATTCNITDLEVEGRLFETFLPATIQDAMTACTKLGIPYLWVDRLCIVQDNSHEKHHQIRAMGAIYSNSYVTLVALGGCNIDYGLPGVSDRKRKVPFASSTQGICLVQMHSSYGEVIETSVWNTRGWTYQEAALSSNLLMFSDTGVFYECGHRAGIRDEDNSMRDCCAEERMFDMSFSQTPNDHAAVKRYAEILDGYTTRKFTFESDILQALSGVLHSQYGRDFYCGLPFRVFDTAIRWTTRDGKYYRRIARDGNAFPSWSWSSVRGPIHIPLPRLFRSFTAPMAIWAKLPRHLDMHCTVQVISPRPIMNTDGQTWNGRPGIPGLAMAIAWREGCFSGQLPGALRNKNTWKEEEEHMSKSWRSLGHLVQDAHGLDYHNTQSLANKLTQGFREPASRPGRIIAYTQSLRLRCACAGDPGDYVMLQTDAGDMIGCLDAKSMDLDNWAHKSEQYFDVLALSVGYEVAADLEHTGLCKSGLADNIEHLCWKDKSGDFLTWGQRDRNADICILYLNLMVVNTKEGVSRRVGLGYAFLKTWVMAKPQFNTFILE